jgi:hypothetical protein
MSLRDDRTKRNAAFMTDEELSWKFVLRSIAPAAATGEGVCSPAVERGTNRI